MAEIRLEGVTVIYEPKRERTFLSNRGVRNYMNEFEDQEFVSRIHATRQEEESHRTGDMVVALDDLSVTIPDGKTLAIVGPSGCGKSTLLRVVAGLIRPEQGTVYFGDKDMTTISPKDRMIGMVFQSYALYPHMKGEGNLGFFFKVRKRTDEEMNERIRITSEIMGIGFDTLLSRKPGSLSGGQQQRVAIGRCIVRDPSIFLFDEPLSNLDAKLRASTRVEIRRLLQRFAITAIYVTHDQIEAITLGDIIAVMRNGRIEQMGTYDEITTNPVNSFVAGFLGMPPMNLIQGWEVAGDGELMSSLGSVAIPHGFRNVLTPGQKITLGFRTGDAMIVPQGEPLDSGGPRIPAEVLNAEPNFAQHHQIVNVQAGDLIFGVQAPLEMQVNTGWLVDVIVPEETAYLFDEETEARLMPEQS